MLERYGIFFVLSIRPNIFKLISVNMDTFANRTTLKERQKKQFSVSP